MKIVIFYNKKQINCLKIINLKDILKYQVFFFLSFIKFYEIKVFFKLMIF